MSRTFKDRPFNVRSNDRNETRRHPYHDHNGFGRTRTISTDENGQELHYYSAAYRRAVKLNSFAGHCTLDEPWSETQATSLEKPCGYLIRCNSNRPRKTDRVFYHSGHRNSERSQLTRIIVLFNTGSDVEEASQAEPLNTRVRRHYGWW